MIGLILLVCVLCTASLITSFLTLAIASRHTIEQRQATEALVDGHNTVARKVNDFTETLDNAMDCLLTLDAVFADSSAEVDATE